MTAKDSDHRIPAPKPRGGAAADDIAGYMPGHEVEDDGPDEIVLPAGPDVAFTKIEWDASVRDTDGKSGTDVIRERQAPAHAPGVYRMITRPAPCMCRQGAQLEEARHQLRSGPFHTDRIGRMVRGPRPWNSW
jgi:excinuclease ABC subunit C